MSSPAPVPTIMVVDDSKTIRSSAESLLKQAGYRVFSAVNGYEAIALLARRRPDMIFIDIMMPRLDGYQACAIIKRNAHLQHIPVVMLSSKDSIFDKARGTLVGADNYLTKPFSRDDLMGAIETHVASPLTPSAHSHTTTQEA